jgi:hypothetical protein
MDLDGIHGFVQSMDGSSQIGRLGWMQELRRRDWNDLLVEAGFLTSIQLFNNAITVLSSYLYLMLFISEALKSKSLQFSSTRWTLSSLENLFCGLPYSGVSSFP